MNFWQNFPSNFSIHKSNTFEYELWSRVFKWRVNVKILSLWFSTKCLTINFSSSIWNIFSINECEYLCIAFTTRSPLDLIDSLYAYSPLCLIPQNIFKNWAMRSRLGRSPNNLWHVYLNPSNISWALTCLNLFLTIFLLSSLNSSR